MALDEIETVSRDPRLTQFQRWFLSGLASVVQSTHAPELDHDHISATLHDRRTATVQVSLPHRTSTRQGVEVSVEADAAVFSFYGDHVHFGYDEPDPPADEALAFARDLLNGRIEVEVRGWLLAAGVTTYRRSANGVRETLQRGGYLGWISVPLRRTTTRISFE